MTTACFRANGNAHMDDGAKWFEDDNPQCPGPGTADEVPNPRFSLLMTGGVVTPNLPVVYPPGVGVYRKRSIAGRTTYEVPAEEASQGNVTSTCTSIYYADTYIWGEGESVYVLKGSKEVHEALNHYHEAPLPKQAYVDFAKSLGAKFYSDWRDYQPFKEDMKAVEAERRGVEKRRTNIIVEATPSEPGAADEPII